MALKKDKPLYFFTSYYVLQNGIQNKTMLSESSLNENTFSSSSSSSSSRQKNIPNNCIYSALCNTAISKFNKLFLNKPNLSLKLFQAVLYFYDIT